MSAPIKQNFPPNIDRIRQFLTPPENAIFAFSPFIYSPQGKEIYPDLIEHESVHLKRQGGYPEQWWERYCTDKQFRLEEETIAYQIQYKYWREVVKANNKDLKMVLYDMAKALSTDYKLDISFNKAENLIRKYANN